VSAFPNSLPQILCPLYEDPECDPSSRWASMRL
jgi:hypothetical protein